MGAGSILIALAVCGLFGVTAVARAQEQHSSLENMIRRFQADQNDLQQFYNLELSETRAKRLEQFYETSLNELTGEPFAKLDHESQIDYVLLRSYVERQLRAIEEDRRERKAYADLIPFAQTIIDFSEARQQMQPIDSEAAAGKLFKLTGAVRDLQTSLGDGSSVDKVKGYRAYTAVSSLRQTLKEWFDFYNGYDPLFTWWVGEPYKAADEALANYEKFLKENVAGIRGDGKDALIGNPVGREALMTDLKANLIPYTPEELIAIAEKEYSWCEAEMKKASRDLGYGDDWRKALEYVKTLHVKPGEQPQMIKELALEAIKFVEDRDLLTVPPLAKETWRMYMMSPDRQLLNPFFLGGDSIIVSFPTNTMQEDQKQMSLRGNNIHFSRATVQHELIPGHKMQDFMMPRYRDYRMLFYTPFWIEGWALYWEMLLWDMDFPKTPENRIGMLFWRMHRCARIVFSLKFHLGEMTAQQCVDYLVDKVGHERANAEGEVRRSFLGGYEPLYQLAYMIGGLQFRALHKELVESGKMTNKQFHDTILQGGPMPVEMVRARLENQKLSTDYESTWRFYPGL